MKFKLNYHVDLILIHVSKNFKSKRILLSDIIFQGKQLKLSKLGLYKRLSLMHYLRTQPILYYTCVDSAEPSIGISIKDICDQKLIQ